MRFYDLITPCRVNLTHKNYLHIEFDHSLVCVCYYVHICQPWFHNRL